MRTGTERRPPTVLRVGVVDSGVGDVHAQRVLAAAAFQWSEGSGGAARPWLTARVWRSPGGHGGPQAGPGKQDGGTTGTGAGPRRDVAADARAGLLAIAGDELGHGDAVIGAISSLVPDARLLVAKVFFGRFTTSAAQVAAAIDWLVSEQADVINLSLGLRDHREVLAQACARAQAAGVVLCAASPARGAPVYPAAYPGVLRMTGDARCAREELSWLATAQADFGGHVQPPPRARAGAGASMGCAHLCGHVLRLLAAGSERSVAAVAAQLAAVARYRGPERRMAGAQSEVSLGESGRVEAAAPGVGPAVDESGAQAAVRAARRDPDGEGTDAGA
ncbi:MAG: S8 family serine peptidase [Rhodocyclaceae bacterium]